MLNLTQSVIHLANYTLLDHLAVQAVLSLVIRRV